MIENLKQNQRVSFKIDNLKGKGKIVGLANNGLPTIGKTYIIEPDIKLDSEVYQYSHFVIPEIFLEKLDNDNKKTTVISAFPGTGKSFLFKNNGNKDILDSDSSTFNKDYFPYNYIEYIKNNIGKVDVILVSSHKVVRDALVEAGIDFTLVFPDASLLDDYIERFKLRGSPENFIKLLNNEWYNFIEDLNKQNNCNKVILDKNEYLSDVIDDIINRF